MEHRNARRRRRRLLSWVGFGALSVLLVLGAVLLTGDDDAPEPLELSQLETLLATGEVSSAELRTGDEVLLVEAVDGTEYSVSYPGDYAEVLTSELLASGVELDVDNSQQPMWQRLLYDLAPVVLLVGVLAWLLLSMQGGRGLGFGRSKARQHRRDDPTVTFDDVAGCPEVVEELREITEFLQGPERFAAFGATVPKGVLLYGPPGTGKTLLARAIAGEAGVPFFSMSGSDFVEMFVGVGASRVRGLFEQAKAAAPSIVFVDEIDAVGRHRGSGHGGGHDEREQTLNQLLVEMDGFDDGAGVILVAATNRPDVLDPALLRPGRFDRQILVDAPDRQGRLAIAEVHARGKPLAPDVDLDVLASRTPGFSGADLANLMNEAALLAARRNRHDIGRREMADATDRVMAGPERRSRVMSKRETQVVAYHESGHALVGHLLPNTDPIHKVSIVARGRALGWTLALPVEDRHLRTGTELRDQLAMLLGGRAAEELIFGDPSTGASDDLERATEIARAMVTLYGMSEAVGPRSLPSGDEDGHGGRGAGIGPHVSDELAALIDTEIRLLLDHARNEAVELLELHRSRLDRLAEALVEHETLEEDQLADLLGAGGSGEDVPDDAGRWPTRAEPDLGVTSTSTMRSSAAPPTGATRPLDPPMGEKP